MNRNIAIALMVVSAGAGFYGGMKYQASQKLAPGMGMFAGRTGNTGLNRGGVAFNGTFGQVIAKTATTLTVQLIDGNSRIVFISGTTPVAKAITGALTDVTVGTNIAVTGTTNSDGSVTASQIQIRPAGTLPPSPLPSQ